MEAQSRELGVTVAPQKSRHANSNRASLSLSGLVSFSCPSCLSCCPLVLGRRRACSRPIALAVRSGCQQCTPGLSHTLTQHSTLPLELVWPPHALTLSLIAVLAAVNILPHQHPYLHVAASTTSLFPLPYVTLMSHVTLSVMVSRLLVHI